MDKNTQKYLLNLVKENYNEIAPDFDNTRNKIIWPELVKIAKNIRDNNKILDIGCGNGRLLTVLKDKNIDYLGVDISENLINLAKKKFFEYKFLVGDILELGKLKEINYDYIFCIAVIQHIPGENLRVASLLQLKNKIKSDGKIIISAWNMWRQKKLIKNIFKFYLLKLLRKNKMDFGDIKFGWKNSEGKIISERYYHAFTKRELKKIIKKAGLKIEKIYKDKYNYYAIINK